MNIKIKAAVITVGLLAAASLVANVLAVLIANLTAEQAAGIFFWGCTTFLVFCFYKLVLIYLESKESEKRVDR